MNRVKQPPEPLMLRPWVSCLLGTVAVMPAWALVDNVRDREWVLVGCFALMTLGIVVQIVGLLWLRRRATRYPEPER